VWRVDHHRRLEQLLPLLQARAASGDELLIQAFAAGPLERTQAVFDHGRLVAPHIYRQVAEGPSGGDVLKVSVIRPDIRATVKRIGGALNWHGALSFDYIVEDGSGQPLFFDANPRLVEPMNALLSGVDLIGGLLDISLGRAPPMQPEGRAGIVTRLGLMALLDAARRRGSRRDVVAELALLARGSGRYAGTIEELTPIRTDRWSAVPLAIVLAKLMQAPSAAERMSSQALKAYSLTPEAIERVRRWASGQ